MKIKFLTIKKSVALTIILAVVMIVCGGVLFRSVKTSASTPKYDYTIVIDAGHGGIDGGAVGKTTKVTESQLNLEYAFELKSICESFGIGVVMTRSNMDGLYEIGASNKKKSEMECRERIINSSGADMVVSLHMNSFPRKSTRGSQVFYREGLESGKLLGESVQKSLKSSIKYAKAQSKVGDFYVLNCTDKPAILVECGFLSNPEEELLLCDSNYRREFCFAIFSGIMSFLKM